MTDRLYGELALPRDAKRLAMSCPMLLRLREVRMPNIGFATFPSFASVTRYEHSLGVGHLAFWWANRNHLDGEWSEALAIAGLYHDGATPAFSHLFEEFLRRGGFDHEKELARVLLGSTDIDGRSDAQVFLGRRCLLQQVLADPPSADSPLSPWVVADLATGHEPLGQVLHGQVDLDNIDNVIRAVTAMGLVSQKESIHPYDVAAALTWEDGELRLEPAAAPALRRWQDLRRRLYSAILDSEFEFRVQSAIKWALEECAANDAELLGPEAWTMTEPQLIERLRAVPRSRWLVDSTRLNRPPQLVLSAWVADLGPLLGAESAQAIAAIRAEVSNLLDLEVYVNFYVDKRERSPRLPRSRVATLFDSQDDEAQAQPPRETNGVPGVVGIVALPRTAFRRPIGATPKAANNTSVISDASTIFKRILGDSPIRVSASWLGSQPRD